MSTNLNPAQVLELITAVFCGNRVETKADVYQFSNDFMPDVVLADEESYLQLKQFEFDIKYDFLLPFTRMIVDIVGINATMRDRDTLIDNYYLHLKNIVKNPSSRLRIIKENGEIVSLVLGSFLPTTRSKTSYDSWGIPEEADSYTMLNLVGAASTYVLSRDKNDDGLIVVSKSYLRVGPLELCGEKFNLLLNTKNQALFTADSSTQSVKKLLDVLVACQAERPQFISLFERFDQPCDKGTRYVAARNKKSYLVLADLAEFANVAGYVKIPITSDDESLGRKVVPLRNDSETELLYKDISLVDKAKLVKSDRYALVGECGPLFIIEKTSKNREIRKKTENTKTFRSDLCSSLLYQFTDLVLGDELDAQNLKPHHRYFPINLDAATEFIQYGWKSSGAPQTIIDAGPAVISNWMLGHLDAALSLIEPHFKQTLLNRAESVFKANNREKFISNLSDYMPTQYCSSRTKYGDTHKYCLSLLDSNNSHLVSFNDKATASLDFKYILSIYNLPERHHGRRYGNGSIELNRASQLHSFYLDNFIPQQAVDEALDKLSDSQLSNSWSAHNKAMSFYHIPDSDILIEEVVSLSNESIRLIKSMAAVKTYSELHSWWTFARQHLETTTLPSLRSKIQDQEPVYINYVDLNFKAFVKYMDWALETLEKAETTFLKLEDN